MPLLNITGLKRGFGSGESRLEVLKGLELNMKEGEVVALMGSSGSGKSTLLNIIGGLLEADSGSIQLGSHHFGTLHPTKLADVRRHAVGWVFQDFHLFNHMTALDNVLFALELSGLRGGESHSKAMEALEKVNMGDRADHKPDELSGGQAQRVAVARAIAGERLLLLADEPTGNLDIHSGDEVMLLFHELASQSHAPISTLMVTHDPNIAKQADRMLLLKDGVLVHSTVEESWGTQQEEE